MTKLAQTIALSSLAMLYDRNEAREAVISGRTFYPDVVGAHLLLPQLRFYYPFSSVDENGDVRDLSGQERHLTAANTPIFDLTSRHAPYAELDGANQDFSRASEAGIIFGQDLTVGCWINLDDVNNTQGFVAKTVAPTHNPEYQLHFNGGVGKFRFGFNTSAATGASTPVAGKWHHLVARATTIVPSISTKIDLFVDGKLEDSQTAGAAISGSQPLYIGQWNSGNYLDGRITQVFGCAEPLPDDLVYWLFKLTAQLMV